MPADELDVLLIWNNRAEGTQMERHEMLCLYVKYRGPAPLRSSIVKGGCPVLFRC